MKCLKMIPLLLLFSACKKDFLETEPTRQVSFEQVFSTTDNIQTVLDGVTRNMRSYYPATNETHDQFGVKSVDLAIDVMSEDIVVEKIHWFGYDYRFDNRTANYPRPQYVWTMFYRLINNVNNVINNVDGAEAPSETVRRNLKARALTLRAYFYFQLIQLFQHTYIGHENDLGVPLYTETTMEGEPRAKVSEVYQRITADLDEAILLFDKNPMTRRHISDVTGNVARGIRARVALVMNDWESAATLAAAARQGATLMNAEKFSAGFDNYTEQNWMWGFEINDEQSTTFGSWFSHMDWSVQGYCGAGYSRKIFSLALYNRMNDADVRKKLVDTSLWASKGWLIPRKFSAGGGKGFSADYVMMRPEEMLLIEAEARARLSQETAARTLLKELRDKRYDTPVTVTAAGDALVEEILLERRIELWGEGFAALDLKRLKRGIDRNNSNHNAVVVTAAAMKVPAEDKRWIYQIPQSEIDANKQINEEHQNP